MIIIKNDHKKEIIDLNENRLSFNIPRESVLPREANRADVKIKVNNVVKVLSQF